MGLGFASAVHSSLGILLAKRNHMFFEGFFLLHAGFRDWLTKWLVARLAHKVFGSALPEQTGPPKTSYGRASYG